MALHRRLLDREPRRDFGIRAALSEQPKDLLLARGQRLLRRRPATRQADRLARHLIDGRRKGLAHREHEILGLRALDHVGGGAELERSRDGPEPVLVGDDDQLAGRRPELRPLEEALPIESIAVDADHGNGEAAVAEKLERLSRGARRRDLEPGGLEGALQRLQPHRLVVQNEYVLARTHHVTADGADTLASVLCICAIWGLGASTGRMDRLAQRAGFDEKGERAFKRTKFLAAPFPSPLGWRRFGALLAYEEVGKLTPKSVASVAAAALGAAGLLGALPSALAATGPPTNTSPPTVSGTATQGQTLTASPGSWSRKPTSYAYQWQRCNSSGAACSSLTGATAKTYTLTSLDVGSTMRVVVKATNSSGTGTANSAPTAVVQPPPTPPANTAPPTISGTVQDGQTLTASPGTWTGTQPISYAYQWQRCDSSGANCAGITAATAATYTVLTADVGGTLAVLVTATNAGGSVAATSSPTATVQPTPPAVTSQPTVSGMAQEGQTLTATSGSWSGTTPIAYDYQWQTCAPTGTDCGPIAGATVSTYAVTTGDVGTTIRVLVTATNAAGSVSDFSAATAVVQSAGAPPANTSPPTISGTAQVGQPLTASPGTWTGTQPISYAYQWQRCDSSGANCNPITGATSAGYTATTADVGGTLSVAVTGSNTVGGATATSAPTATVQSAGSATIFSDGFESGNFSAWSSVVTGGDGTATVQSAIVRTGSYAAQLSESANTGSKSYVRETFSAQQDLTAAGDFQVLQQGASGGNVPFFRLLDPSGTRIVSLYRQNGTTGTIGLTYGGLHPATTGKLALNTSATLSIPLTTSA